jgi:hypothetical protein
MGTQKQSMKPQPKKVQPKKVDNKAPQVISKKK